LVDVLSESAKKLHESSFKNSAGISYGRIFTRGTGLLLSSQTEHRGEFQGHRFIAVNPQLA
jgi:hypothetical protein